MTSLALGLLEHLSLAVTTNCNLNPQIRVTAKLDRLYGNLFCQLTGGRDNYCSNVGGSGFGISLSFGKFRILSEDVLDSRDEEAKCFTSTSSCLRNTK